MPWNEERRLLVSQLLARGVSPAEIAAQLGTTEHAVRGGMTRYGLAEATRGTRIFVTAQGKRVRRMVKPRRLAKVTLAPIRTECDG